MGLSMKNVWFLFSLFLISCCTSKKCFWKDCGCPSSFNQPWCSESSFSDGWCSESDDNCSTCDGVYCDSATDVTVVTTTTTTTSTTTASNSDITEFFEANSGEYSGEGTYYKLNGGTPSCEMTKSNMELAQSLQTVAVSPDDYFDGITCGMCIEVKTMEAGGETGHDVLTTPFTALVTNLCPGCAKGDLDILIDDSSPFTGRNPVTWRPVDCPVDSQPFRFRISSGSNGWYTKLQVRHAKRPVASVAFVGKDGSWVNLLRTPGFFDTNIENVDNYIQRPIENGPITVRVCDIYGNCENDAIPNYTTEVDQVGVHQFPNL